MYGALAAPSSRDVSGHQVGKDKSELEKRRKKNVVTDNYVLISMHIESGLRAEHLVHVVFKLYIKRSALSNGCRHPTSQGQVQPGKGGSK
jgi:hypothetical protein